ncbi:MAG: polyprenyl synthetase family protein [Desulfobacterales bacterium]|nr:polyprenyl synthetase family protein [Desulfobacterales bacterium]
MNREELLALLKPEITRIDQTMRNDLAVINNTLLAEIVHYASFSGGKRIRPLLCVLSARICNRDDDDLYQLAIAFEYLHAATLLHDDVIDHADTRRGQPSVNSVWGISAAILAGDFLHARAMFLFGLQCKSRCLELISHTTGAMVEGELLQMANARNFNQSEDDYFQVINNKSALLIASACETGAIFARAGEERITALRSYGANLGTAFQIIDDLLDYQGDPQQTGKVVGNDFCECKMTLPLIHALGRATGKEQDRVLGLLAGPVEERRRALAEIRELINKYQGFARARQQAGQYIERALTELEIFSSAEAGPVKKILTSLGRYILTREK